MKRNFVSAVIVFFSCLFSPLISADRQSSPPVYTINITDPTDQETFQNDAQSITVTVSVTPDLAPNDNVVILVDGSESGDPQHATSIALPYLERGPHTLQAKVIQPDGQGATSSAITIYQQRTSKLLHAK